MLLAIDSGNTNIVFAVFDADGGIVGEWRSLTDPDRTADDYGVWLTQLMKLDGVDRRSVSSAILATVVPATLFALKSFCRKYFGCDPLIVGEAGVDLGLKVLVDHPEEVGADRLVNSLAAHEKYGGPLIVVDFGTATTFDVVDGQGDYCGGVIAPGINLSLEALHQAAAKLPRIAIAKPAHVIGKGTEEAMRSGMFWGYGAMIEGLTARIEAEFGAPMKVIATGGLAALFLGSVDCIAKADKELTLNGLYSIFKRNQHE